jgi:formylglycine-generating enzyme required for sulfatase activity
MKGLRSSKTAISGHACILFSVKIIHLYQQYMSRPYISKKFKNSHILLILLCCGFGVVLTGCFKKEVEGQVFIATEGGENIKLGLVDIYVFSEPEFREVSTAVSQELLELADARASAENSKFRKMLPLEEAIKQLDDLRKEIEGNPLLTGTFRREALEVIAKAVETTKKKKDEIDRYPRIPRVSKASEIMAKQLNSRMPAGKSDADGLFRVTASKGDIIYATGSRLVGESREYYYWVVPLVDTKNQLLISNDGLAEASSGVMARIFGGLSEDFSSYLSEMSNEEGSLAHRLYQGSGLTLPLHASRSESADPVIKEFADNLIGQVSRQLKSVVEAAELARLEAERKAEILRAWASSPEGKDMELDFAGTSLEMKWIAPGSFLMGSPSGENGRYSDEGPQTRVKLSKGYWLGKHEVTQAQWQALMGNNPSNFKGSSLPVENVSWNDAMEFCRKLTQRERAAGRLPEGLAYTLPTEAQWEYACRAGTTTALNNGTNLTSTTGQCRNLDALGWYGKNSGSRTHSVGQKQPNSLGLYDMHGNVCEWCLDWKDDYPGGSVTDPTGPLWGGSNRVGRGGGWFSLALLCRSAFRYFNSPDNRSSYLGFRLALSQVP